jgi:predicted protein tyrosine phosphatase
MWFSIWSNMEHVLFIRSRNRLRSPTAEQVFSSRKDIEVASAGLNHDATQPLTPSLVEWADTIFVMEQAQLNRLRKRYRKYLNRQRVVCLDIPDIYDYMEPALVELLTTRIPRYLGLQK